MTHPTEREWSDFERAVEGALAVCHRMSGESVEQRLADELAEALDALPADGPNVVKLRRLYDAILDYRTRRAAEIAAQERAGYSKET